MLLTAPSQAHFTGCSDWELVDLVKCDQSGDLIKVCGSPVVFPHYMEKSSGDLYGIRDAKGKIDQPSSLALKATLIIPGSLVYTVGMMTVAAIRVGLTVSKIFWQIPPLFVSDLQAKGFLASLSNTTMRLVWQIPTEITKDIWRLARSPVYGVGMMLASAYAVILYLTVGEPFEGVKWLGKIEHEWHEGISYQSDIRYGKTKEQVEKMSFFDLFFDISEGKIFYLGYCMQIRGNIHEKVAEKKRFELLDNQAHKVNRQKLPNDKRKKKGGIMSDLLVHWNSNDFSKVRANLRNDNDLFMIEGERTAEFKTIVFKCDKHKNTQSLFPRVSHLASVFQDVGYSAAFFPHKGITAIGNAGLTLWDGVLACKKVYLEKMAFSKAAKPVVERLKTLAKDGGILAIPVAMWYWSPTLYEFDINKAMGCTALAVAVGYSFWNPKGTKVHVADLEDMIHPKQVREWDQLKPWTQQWTMSLLDGSYRLSRIFNMHRIAKASDKTPGGKTRADSIEQKKGI